jgi:hypothetical protein
MQFVAIICLSVAAAVTYGIVHDQITSRICVEYFTIGHAPVFGTDDPTLLALGWGVIATWWVGLILGVPLAMAARLGKWPKRNAMSLLRPIAWMMLVTAICAAVAGVIGWLLARNGIVLLLDDLADRVPRDKHVPFLACLWAHSASYLVGFVGGVIVIVRVRQSRFKAARHVSSLTHFRSEPA